VVTVISAVPRKDVEGKKEGNCYVGSSEKGYWRKEGR
jgi:hypothetical protein